MDQSGDATPAILAQAALPDFSGLPGYAQAILYSVLAVGLALSFLIPRMGFLHGRETTKAGPASGGAPLIVAAVADPTALNTVSAAITGLTHQLAAGAAIQLKLAEEINDLRQELRFTNNKTRNDG